MATTSNLLPPVQAVAMIAIDTDISAHQAAAQERDRGQLRMIAAALTAQTPEQFAAGLDAIIERIRS